MPNRFITPKEMVQDIRDAVKKTAKEFGVDEKELLLEYLNYLGNRLFYTDMKGKFHKELMDKHNG